MNSFPENYHGLQDKAYFDIKDRMQVRIGREFILTSGLKPFWWGKRGTFFLTTCGRIGHFNKDKSNAQVIQPEIFNKVKNVILVKYGQWMVLFEDGELALFEQDMLGSRDSIKMEKIGSISGINHLVELPINPDRDYVVAVNSENKVMTIQSNLDQLEEFDLTDLMEVEVTVDRIVGSNIFMGDGTIFNFEETPPQYDDDGQLIGNLEVDVSKNTDVKILDVTLRGNTYFSIDINGNLYAKSYRYDHHAGMLESRRIRLDIGEVKPQRFLTHSEYDNDELVFLDDRGIEFRYNTKTYFLYTHSMSYNALKKQGRELKPKK